MRVKTKLTLGLAFLFTVIVILSAISINYLISLNVRSQALLEVNYRALENVHGLEASLNEIRNSFEPIEDSRVRLEKIEYRLNPALESFQKHLKEQQLTLTEEGEAELVNEIAIKFEALKNFLKVTRTKDYYFEKLIPLIQDLNEQINKVYLLNQQSIYKRNQRARATAEKVVYSVIGIVILCIVVAFSFLLRFPRLMADPVEKLTEAIEKIKQGDYSTRVNIATQDEFGALGHTFNNMMERLEAFEKVNLEKVMLEKQRIDHLITKISEGIIGLDADFNILFINPFALKALGMNPEINYVGRSASELSLNNEMISSILNDLIEYTRSGKRYTRNKLVKGTLKEKPAYFVRKVVTTQSEMDGERQPNSYILMLKNITEYKELDEARTNFIATVSHELKTPIASIKMSLKLLQDERLSVLTTEQEELVEDVEWEVSRLLNITQELLNANEVESGRIQLHPGWISVDEILEEAIDGVITLAEDRKITISKKVESNFPPIFADGNKITWVLINFLTNGIKYTPVGSEIELQAYREKNDLILSVRDEGEGIPEDQRDKIFDRYYRIPGSKGKGTGLGLSISKEIVSQMNGKIGVESTLGEGSLFYLRLHDIFEEKASLQHNSGDN